MRVESRRRILKNHLHAYALPHDHLTAVRRTDPHDTARQRRLSDAGRPDQTDDLAPVDLQIDLVKHRFPAILIDRKALGEPANRKQRVCASRYTMHLRLCRRRPLFRGTDPAVIMRIAFAIGCVAEQFLRIGMLRTGKNPFRLSFLHDQPVLHHHDAIRDLLCKAQIMRDKKHAAALLHASLAQQPHDLLLRFDVQRRRWFIGDQKLRLGDHRQRDRGPLQHPAAEFMRILPRTLLRLVKAQLVKQSHCRGLCPAPLLLSLRSPMQDRRARLQGMLAACLSFPGTRTPRRKTLRMQKQHLRDLCPDRIDRVKR